MINITALIVPYTSCDIGKRVFNEKSRTSFGHQFANSEFDIYSIPTKFYRKLFFQIDSVYSKKSCQIESKLSLQFGGNAVAKNE